MGRLSGQVVGALVSHGEGREFESDRTRPSHTAVEMDTWLILELK